MSRTARHTGSFLPLALAAAVVVYSFMRAHADSVPRPNVNPSQVLPAPPPIPQIVSPVDQFRALLALPPDVREARLTNRPPLIRNRIIAKLREYDAMKPDERELRLRSTQLRWYMLSFMELPATQRDKQLETVPESDRAMLRDHLAQWDRVPQDEQKEVLKYEKVIENLIAQGFTNAPATTNIIAATPAVQHESTSSIDAFLKMPVDQRQQMYDSFQRFFDLSDAEKQKTLGALPPAERLQMSLALKQFSLLPKQQRDQCLNSFSKFSSMSEAERQEFLKNAERWRELTPAERQAWRNLVTRLPHMPPLPPGILVPPSPLPPRPLPLRMHPSLAVTVSQTNATQ